MSLFDAHKMFPSRGYFMFGQSDEDGTQPGPNNGVNKYRVSSSNTEESKHAPATNLFPLGSKTEELKAAPARTCPPLVSTPDFGLFIDQTVECMICLEVGKHCTGVCPYMDCVPKNAHVGSGCEVVCRNCGYFFLGRCCGLDEGRAILKQCLDCGESGHWSNTCPRNDGVDVSTRDPLFANLGSDKHKVAADWNHKMAHIH